MSELLLVNHPDYWRSSVKPRGFAEFCDMVDTQGKITGLWEIAEIDTRTGEAKKRVWSKNVVTDNGAVNILASAIANASNANPWNTILTTNNSGSTTLTAALTANATNVTTLSVAATPAAIPSGTTLQLGYGTSNTQNVVTNGVTAQGATSITVNSFTVNSTGFSVGANVVPQPSVTDNPTNANLTANATTPLSQYSGVIAAGGFTYSATTGAGNRSVVVTFAFKTATNGGSTTAGIYTDFWLVNVTSGASNATTGLFVGNYINHVINNQMQCNNLNNMTATLTIKI